MVTEILAGSAIVISVISFAFTYRVMRDQLTEDTGADLHAAVMKLIEIQGSMPDHPNTTRNAKNQVHHLALTVESLIERAGEDLQVPVTGYLALGWSFELVEEDEKAEKYHQTACHRESVNHTLSFSCAHPPEPRALLLQPWTPRLPPPVVPSALMADDSACDAEDVNHELGSPHWVPYAHSLLGHPQL